MAVKKCVGLKAVAVASYDVKQHKSTSSSSYVQSRNSRYLRSSSYVSQNLILCLRRIVFFSSTPSLYIDLFFSLPFLCVPLAAEPDCFSS